MHRYPSTFKNCATCTHWGGERKMYGMGKNVEVTSEKGKCLIPKGGWKGSMKTCASTCKDYMKWQQLK